MIKVLSIEDIEQIIRETAKVEPSNIRLLSNEISYGVPPRETLYYLDISEIISWLVKTERDKLNFIDSTKVEYKIIGDQLVLAYSDNFIDSEVLKWLVN